LTRVSMPLRIALNEGDRVTGCLGDRVMSRSDPAPLRGGIDQREYGTTST
jgi:hypothetical protein